MAVYRYEKPRVLARIPLDDHAIIEASAGTGKTYTLEHLLVELLLRGTGIDQILVVTFTEKATEELRARVRAKLEELVALDHDLASPDVPDERCWLIGDVERERLVRAVQAFDTATIATIHAFCQRILTEHAFANRRLFNQEQVDGRQAFGMVFKEVLRQELAREGETQQYLRAALSLGLDVPSLEDQLYACMKAHGELLPRFDRGELSRALAEAPLAAFVDPKLAAEFKAAKVNAATAKAICSRLATLTELIERHRRVGDVPLFLAELERTTRDTSGGFLSYITSKLETVGFAPGSLADQVQVSTRDLRVSAVPLVAALAHIFLSSIERRLEQKKRDKGLFDFDDMLSLVRKTLRGRDGAGLARALRARYRYALIDEFQDTDDTQWEIFCRVFFESNRENVLYLIGDPKQAIYAFRGADVNTYVDATRLVLAEGGARVPLDESYRSTSDLIDAYNEIFDQRADPPFFSSAHITYSEPVRCGDPSLRATDYDGRAAVPIHLFTVSGKASAAQVNELLGDRIAREIGALLDPSHPTLLVGKGDKLRPLRARDVFVLTFSKREGLLVGERLRARGIPHSYYKQDGLFEREEARHVLDLLMAIDDPRSPSKRIRAYLTPFFGLSFEQAHLCKDLPPDHPLVATLYGFHGLAHEKRYERLFSEILERTGIVRRELFFKDGERGVTNYLHVFEILLEQVGRTRLNLRELSFTLKAFIDGKRMPLGEAPGVQRLESDRDAVQIMTMHKSKGLEAEVVFLAGGFKKPSVSPLIATAHVAGRRVSYIRQAAPDYVLGAIEREDREEDERLLYVAITRARSRLYLPCFPAVSKDDVRPDGPYAPLNDRLRAMITRGLSPRFSSEPLALSRDAAAGLHDPGEALSHWQPPPELLSPGDERLTMATLRRGRGGFAMTSYTQMQKGYRHAEPEAGPDDQGGDVPPEVRSPDDLPGGAASGIFLHDVIEVLPFDALASCPTPEALAAHPITGPLIAEMAKTHDIDRRYLPSAIKMIHAALTAPVDLGDTTLQGFFRADRSLREMEFLFPLPAPEAFARLLDEPESSRRGRGLREASPGFVKGFVDFLFEQGGRAYFVDWKSDGLRSFAPSHLERHVLTNYPRQMQLYSLALVRMLGITDEASFERRFGGMVYAFLRAMPRGPGEGLYFRRPVWADILAWEDDLVRYGQAMSVRGAA